MDIFSFIMQSVVQMILWFWWLIAGILGFAAWQNYRKAHWAEKQDHVLLNIKIPRSNDKDSTAAEMMFASLHGILKPKTSRVKEGSLQEYLSFEMVATNDAIHFYTGVPTHLRDFVESQIYAQYPSAEISETKDYTNIDIDNDGQDDAYACAELTLKRSQIVPIKTFQSFKVDPLAGITSALAKLDNEKEKVWIQILARPVPDTWQARGAAYIQSKKTGQFTFTSDNLFKAILNAPVKLLHELMKHALSVESGGKEPPKLSQNQELEIAGIQEKISKLGFQVKLRLISLAKEKSKADLRLNAAIGAFKQFSTINLNSFVATRIKNRKAFLDDYRNRAFYDKGFIFNIEELASIFHLPHTSVETPNINWTSSKTGEPPTELPNPLNTDVNDLTLFAETNFRHQRILFGIKTDDKRRHSYLIGKSGMGKSKLLEKFIEEDINKGRGLAIIDPNGDLIVDTLKKIPDSRVNDVILLDPADQEYPVGFNPLEVNDDNLKHFIANGFVGILQKLFGHSWGPRLEYILNYTILALLDYPNSTTLGIVRMLTDKNFRKKVVEQIKDPVVKKFWTTEFASFNEKFATEAVAPILNKVGQFVASSLIRNIIGQPKSTIDIRKIMDEKKILLINLSTGKVGETNSALLGGMIITKIQLAAMSRANIPLEDRVDFTLYVDEFQHFATESFATILSEARKYRLSLVVANQYIAQMDETVRDAVFGNVGTMITFRVGAQDAGMLEKELNPPFEVNDIINLDRQQIYLKMTIDGKTSNPFSARTLDITSEDMGNTEKIINLSRERYSKTRKEVEDDIAKWHGLDTGDEEISEKKFTSPIVKKESNSHFEAPVVKNNNFKEKPKSSSFEPPIVKKFEKGDNQRRDKKKKHQKVNFDVLKDALKKASPKGTDQNIKKINNIEEKPETPKEGIPKPVNNETVKKIINNALDKEDKEVLYTPPKELESEKKTEKPLINEKEEITHKIEKQEKIITPENFKEVTKIHPNEKVIIQENNPQEIKQGETIVFEDLNKR
ncbi:MAG: type IV secretion system DNA-binding domain-containing protein [Patescibacteria group bacterium]|nr:type IV secretion system DNA-binding domain-containing protein [Patescibacteria group bacterium]